MKKEELVRKNNMNTRKRNIKACDKAWKSREDSFERKETTTLYNISENSKNMVTVSLKFSLEKITCMNYLM